MTTPTRTHAGGSICPLCTWAQANGHPHPCITNPTAAATVTVLRQTGVTIPDTVADQLTAHPAQPLGPGAVLRPVHPSWCFCQCSPTASTAAPGKARS